MKNRTFFLMIIFICFYNYHKASADALELIFSNKETFYSMFNHDVGINEKRRYRFKNEEFFLNNYKNDYTFWKNKKNNFYEIFINSITQICYFQKDSSSVINDSIYILPLIELLKDSAYTEIALDKLINKTSYEMLIKYSVQIKNALQKSKVTDMQKNYLLALLKLSQKEADALLKKEDLPIEIKARLGDLNACDSLKVRYLRANGYDNKVDALKLLLYVGTDDLIKFVVSHFYDPVYKMQTKDCISEAIRYPLLKGLQKHFPNEPFINSEVDYFFMCKLMGKDEVKAKELFQKINLWAKNKFNLELNSTDCKLVLLDRCIKW